MKYSIFGEIIIMLFLSIVLIFFINPFDIAMSAGMHTIMIPLTIILLVIMTGFLWKEQRGDERQQLHKAIASRFSYFAGILTLVVGILLQNSQNALDPWLVITVCSMLLAKIIGLMYGYINN